MPLSNCQVSDDELDIEEVWAQWKSLYGKTYDDEATANMRHSIFVNDVKLVRQCNKKAGRFTCK